MLDWCARVVHNCGRYGTVGATNYRAGMKISGSRIMLTGASGGLGRAIARLLSANNAELLLTARNQQQLEALAKETMADVLLADMCEQADLDRLVERFATTDVLIANAGRGGDLGITEDTAENIDRVIDINFRAPIHLATEFAQQKLAADAPGHIVLVGSLSGLAASPNTRMYNATKFGLRGFSLALRQDLEGSGIGVSIVEPGFIRDAGMFADSGMSLPSGVRTKSPEDVARGVMTAIEKNRGEVFVAPVELRASATFATVAPGLSARIQNLIGASDITTANTGVEN